MSNSRRKRGRPVHGILVLDKPAGMSSNAALQEVKRAFSAQKAGHTGSLDPLATGVLPVCLGEATKISQFLLDSDKGYRAKLKFGVETDSGDSDGEIIARHDVTGLAQSQVEKMLTRFEGEIQQLPPMHSALKHKGTPLYKLARKGEVVEREPRTVTIHDIRLNWLDGDEGEIEVRCSKGTYIRTIATDLGQMLGCGAHITGLRRLQAGVFTETESVTLDRLKALRDEEGLQALDDLLVPMDRAIEELPKVVMPSITAHCVKHGQSVTVRHLPEQGLVRMYENEHFIGIGFIDDDGMVAPKRLVLS